MSFTNNKSIEDYINTRNNNFNLLRFIAAFCVLWAHSYTLIGIEHGFTIHSLTPSRVAVDTFFVISGFLISRSFYFKRSYYAFFVSRILRIYPGLVAAVIFCILLGYYFTGVHASEYFTNYQTIKFFVKNILLYSTYIEYELPGVFLDVPYPSVVNGSLWTLPYEIRMYILVPILFLFLGRFHKLNNILQFKVIILCLAIAVICIHIINHYKLLPFMIGEPKFIRLFAMFLNGMVFFYWRDRIKFSFLWFSSVALLLLIALCYQSAIYALYCFLLPYFVFFLVYIPAGGVIRSFNKFGDYSYGIYIYAFPVQQTLVSSMPSINAWSMIIMSFLITLLIACFSWHFVESKFLKIESQNFNDHNV